MLDYWGFFPAETGWGRIPAMGFGDVVRSRHPGVPEGDRSFGFFPMSNYLVIDADRVSDAQIVDAAPHRANHAPAYRQYTRTGADPLYQASREDQHMLLFGLFMTSFLSEDFIADNDFFGAEAFVVASASSKTALALAHQLKKRAHGKVYGLTSSRNRDFVVGTALYDEVVPYDDLKSLPAGTPVVFIDHSGNGDVISGLHHHFGDNLKYSCIVGATHWDASPRPTDLPGAEPTFFFAPGQIVKRNKEWGPGGFQERLGGSLADFLSASSEWMQVARGNGRDEVSRVFQQVLAGEALPSEGHVLSLWDAD
jgi:hypothetical protein